ncbi:MAG TPA: hypothetical protein VF510_25525 [Ktedonobacterales bacterium]|jgi:hypothetical protein
MRPLTRQWLGMAALALALLIAGCSGTSGTSSTGQGPSATGTKPANKGHALATGINTVSFTASGGLTGSITLSTDLNTHPLDLLSYHLAKEQLFYIDLTDQSGKDRQQFILDFTGYTGPGTYTVTPSKAGDAADEAIHFELIEPGASTGNNLWLIDKSVQGSCTVTISSVTPVGFPDKAPLGRSSRPTSGFSEVLGTIACPSVPVYLADGTKPLTVSDGKFDVVMAEQQ